MSKSGTKWAAAIVVASCMAQAVFGQAIQQGSIPVELELVATVGSGASAPNFGAHSGDPRFLYIGQKTGAIRILDFDQPNPLSGTTFLNVNTALPGFLVPGSENAETGLLGGAFHPDFNAPESAGFRKFYTYTSESIVSPVTFTHPEIGNGGNHQSVIREWTAGAPNAQGITTIDTSISSRVLMRINQPQGNHNGGALAFGPDNYLYIALGDGGSGNDFSGFVNSSTDGHTNQNNPDTPGGFLGHGNAQDRRNVFGSILRIKPTADADDFTGPSGNGQYRIPNDNPFTESAQADNPIPGWQANWVDEIYAYGLRNPFRVSFDRETGKLYAADVGQVTREEVNMIESGGNYGWVAREGRIQNPAVPFGSPASLYAEPAIEPFIDPIADYPRGAGGGFAVIGGYVYRGERIPELQGKYVFGDLNRSGVSGGGMLYMDILEPGPNQVFDLAITGSFAKPGANIHGLAEDADGEIYYLFANGQIVKLRAEIPLIAGDYNRDGRVDELDYNLWKATFGRVVRNDPLPADGNGNGIVDAADYTIWRDNLGASAFGSDSTSGSAAQNVPEPAAGLLLAQMIALAAGTRLARRRREAGGRKTGSRFQVPSPFTGLAARRY